MESSINDVFKTFILDSNESNSPDSGRDKDKDALNTSPSDIRADDKVIVNEQRSNKTVNAPSQTAVNTSEENGNDEEIVDNQEDTDE